MYIGIGPDWPFTSLDTLTSPMPWSAHRVQECVLYTQAVVSDRLDVRLEPVDLRLKPPSAAEFHHSLQTLFSEGACLVSECSCNGPKAHGTSALRSTVASRILCMLFACALCMPMPFSAPQINIQYQYPATDATFVLLPGITQRSTVKERSHDVQYTVWEKRFRNGICRTGEYYVGRPATRCDNTGKAMCKSTMGH